MINRRIFCDSCNATHYLPMSLSGFLLTKSAHDLLPLFPDSEATFPNW